MTLEVYKFKPGECVCLIGDPLGGAKQVNILKLSGAEAVLEPTVELRRDQFVYTTVKLEEGPSLSLSGMVVTSASGGIYIQWTHAKPGDADKVDCAIREHLVRRGELPASPSAGGAPADPEPPPDKPAPPRRMLDVSEHIRKRAKRVRSSDLASRVETVQVLDMKTIRSLIKEAAGEAVELLGPMIREEERKRLLDETEESFKERLEVFKSVNAGLEEKTRVLQEKLERAQAILEEERRSIVSARQFTVSDAGMVELDQRLGRLLDRALHAGHAGEDLEREMRGVVARLLDDEREKIREQAQAAQSDRIALLEKKVERLASSLESTEKERDLAQRRAQALEASGGVVFGNVLEAGLDDSDPERELKLQLLRQIFDFNKEIRQELSEAGRLPPPRERRAPGAEAGTAHGDRAGTPPGAEAAAAVEERAEGPAAASAGEGEPDPDPGEETPEADPDDLLWEPVARASGGEGVRIRNLGG